MNKIMRIFTRGKKSTAKARRFYGFEFSMFGIRVNIFAWLPGMESAGESALK